MLILEIAAGVFLGGMGVATVVWIALGAMDIV